MCRSPCTHNDVRAGAPCDAAGRPLPPGSPPQPLPPKGPDDYNPFQSRPQFEVGDFLFRKEQMSAGNINELMQLWAATLPPGQDPPFADAKDMLNTIDLIPLVDMPWQAFIVKYVGPQPARDPPPWMDKEYTVWFRCPRHVLHMQLSNSDFAAEMDYTPRRVYRGDEREYGDFMSGDWAWSQADTIGEDPEAAGAAFCPIILGSDKTTVSVATGQNEYYPLYLSNGLVHNSAQRAQRNAVSLVAFLSIPKTDRQYAKDPKFRKFRRQLFHTSLHTILQSLRPGMTKAEVVRCADGHFRRVIYGLGPYIADYPEQVLLSCVVQGWCAKCTAHHSHLDGSDASRRSHAHTRALFDVLDLKGLWDEYGIVGDLLPFTVGFPRADIHEMLSPDLLHQVIKGTFKDHLVTWVEEYLELVHGKPAAAIILADIDHRIAAVPSFPGLRRFPEGRGFKQWTGDDSKALMKVYLPAIAGYVPAQMVRALSAFLEFCYLVRRDVITTGTLAEIEDALSRFHRDRVIFEEAGVRLDGISLPRQHALIHYLRLIQLYGAPNGLCSSITESKHIKAVKEPYRRSNRYEALGQMLLTNQRLDKLAAARVDFSARGMLSGACSRLPSIDEKDIWAGLGLDEDQVDVGPAEAVEQQALLQEDEDCAPVDDDVLATVVLAKRKARGYPRTTAGVAEFVGVLELPQLIRHFLYVQESPDEEILEDVDPSTFPLCPPRVLVFPSAVAVFHASSDLSGVKGMKRERIRACRSWRGGPGRYDCAYVVDDQNLPGFRGLAVVRVHLLFSFKTAAGILYSCALVSWFVPSRDTPCDETGMWIVEPQLDLHGLPVMSVISLDCVLRAAHLIGVAGTGPIPPTLRHTDSLDAFNAFYVNKYADHHAHEIAF
ncbi:hypothetical protein C8Q73DRAFT_658720 [Cubamyces lactineus]|nr:hypothetical protein C8Q73DRAFT_658720 [Cubamyces lactineus]